MKKAKEGSSVKKKAPHHAGHRKRMREKLMQPHSEHLSDRELLEMLLFMINKRQDVKPLAHAILNQFGMLKRIILTDDENHLKELTKYNSGLPGFIKLLREVILNILKSEIQNKVILNVWSEMIEYVRVKFGHLKQEYFNVLYLDVTCKLLKIVTLSEGTIDESAVYTREVIRRGLELGATSIILVHNHFSGETNPSAEDIEITKEIVKSCNVVNISVIDHVIVSVDSYYSFRASSLL